LSADTLHGRQVNLVQLAGAEGHVVTAPQYALRFTLPLGSLGKLAESHDVNASLILGWGPNPYAPDDDGVGLFLQLPSIGAEAFGFRLQGLVKVSFGDANLMSVDAPGPDGTSRSHYVLLLNNVALKVLGISLPPKVITDFLLFAGEDDHGTQVLGWNLAATQLSGEGGG
jgi:hypothetical protein